MLRQWGVNAHRDVMDVQSEAKLHARKILEKMKAGDETNAIFKSQSSRSLVTQKVSAPPGSESGPRVIKVAVDDINDDVTDDEEEEDSFESTSSDEDDEGLSTVYEAEEEEQTVPDNSSDFQYYSIDDVELDDVTSEYDATSARNSYSTPTSTLDERNDSTPTPSNEAIDVPQPFVESVTPTPREEAPPTREETIPTPEVESVIGQHERQDSDELTGTLVRRKAMRPRHKTEKKTEESAVKSKSSRGSNSFREFFRGPFRSQTSRLPEEGVTELSDEINVSRSFDSDVTDMSKSGDLLSYRSESQSSLSSAGTSFGTPRPTHFVVVAVDFGTTYSGYAFSFVHRPDTIHMMRRWAGGDPGINNQKTPTTILLTPTGAFHSFGFEARDFYHDLDPSEARNWFYFERFKMALHSNVELSDELGTHMRTCDVRWVVTVPAIWRPQAKQFMREAAYQAGLATESNPSQLVIALEPEAASIYCRKLRHTQLQSAREDATLPLPSLKSGCQYMVVDCGGGTVDVTVHQIVGERTLQEVRAASGGAMGSVAVDADFERLLRAIFGDDFIDAFRRKRPAGAVDLFVAWESRKRSLNLSKQQSVNISLPFSFIDLHRRIRGFTVDVAVKKYSNDNVRWSQQGMLRLTPDIMRKLFQPTLDSIVSHVVAQIDHKITHLFLVGGFAESPLLQQQLREAVGNRVRVIIPNDVSLTILKGAVLFGLDPTTVQMRTSQMTYGVGILNKFNSSIHPKNKRLVRGNSVWCTDVFDAYVCSGHLVGLGDVVQRSYAPVRGNQSTVVINLYSCERADVKFIDEHGVRKCATLRINLPVTSNNNKQIPSTKRELQISMMFGDTEIKVHCLDVITGTKVKASIDFLTR